MVADKKIDDERISKVLGGDLLSKITKKHGTSILAKASDFGTAPVPRVPTGIFMLDYGLGGGFPIGRVNVVYGHKSSGKTTSLLKMAGNAQRMCANCWTFLDEGGKCACKKYRQPMVAYIDVEGTWDAKWAITHKMDLDKVILSVPEYAEQSLDIADALVRSGDVDIIILDSIAFLTPALEIEQSIEKQTMGTQPRIVGSGVRKLVSGLNAIGNERGHDKRPTVFMTNQIRMKLGVMFGSPETTPGGLAPGFAASTETRFWAGKYEMDEVTGKALHVLMNFKIEKNKTSSAKMEGDYKMILADTETKKVGDIFEEDKMVEMAEKVGMIEKKGADWFVLGEKFSAKSHIERQAMTDPVFKLKFGKALLNVLLAA